VAPGPRATGELYIGLLEFEDVMPHLLSPTLRKEYLSMLAPMQTHIGAHLGEVGRDRPDPFAIGHKPQSCHGQPCSQNCWQQPKGAQAG
jgi:hypothetical protein